MDSIVALDDAGYASEDSCLSDPDELMPLGCHSDDSIVSDDDDSIGPIEDAAAAAAASSRSDSVVVAAAGAPFVDSQELSYASFCADMLSTVSKSRQSLCTALVHYMQSSDPDADADADAVATASSQCQDYIFRARLNRDSPVPRNTSWKAECNNAQTGSEPIGISTLKARYFETAEILWQMSRVCWASMAAKVVRLARQGLVKVLLVLYTGLSDEASFKLRQTNVEGPTLASGPRCSEGQIKLWTSSKTTKAQTPGTVKVLYSEFKVAILFKDLRTCELHEVYGEIPIPLQCLDACTGENYTVIQKENYKLEGYSELEAIADGVVVQHTQDSDQGKSQINWISLKNVGLKSAVYDLMILPLRRNDLMI